MRELFRLRATPPDVALRAMAMVAIVYHHAHLLDAGPFGLAGGMTFLMMLSGLNFARFAVKDATADGVRQSILELARQVWVPSLLLVLLSFAVYGKFDLLELLFVRNWRDTKHIAAFYDWYPQVLLQLLAVFYLMFSVPALSRGILRHPARAMLALFAIGLALRVLAPLVWDTAYLRHRLPHTFLWNFVLGGVVYFLVMDRPAPKPASRAIVIACVVAGAVAAWNPRTFQFWWLVVGGVMLATVRQVWLPAVVSRIAVILSSATLTIFLTHLIWFKLLNNLYGVVTASRAVLHPDLLAVLALTGSVAMWVAFRALRAAWRLIRLQPLGRGAEAGV